MRGWVYSHCYWSTRNVRQGILVFTLAILTVDCRGAVGSYYERFVELAGTNLTRYASLRSPLLVDTNNQASKLPKGRVSLLELRTHAGLAGVRLGMSMEDLVAVWGKPPALSTWCMGGHRFHFKDVSAVFDADRLATIFLPLVADREFDHGLTARSGIEEWVRALGEPTTQYDYPPKCVLAWEAPQAVLSVDFGRDGVFFGWVRLEANYGQRFLAEYGTNPVKPELVTAPSLVDTNNNRPCLGGSPISLAQALERGQIGIMRLGMSMHAVVAFWGKPTSAWSGCEGGPRFRYRDVIVCFEANHATRIGTVARETAGLRFSDGITPNSSAEQWIGALGQPTSQETNAGVRTLRYATNGLALEVWLASPAGGLEYFGVRSTPGAAERKAKE